ncbi:MAG TPA: nuclear transport factor 2 family protein [Polyangiaceae bacterium]|jgi:hypothetical protein|nr:nuclear transport factor 2 family protein [Polyangiaceae bacterium]
MRKTSLVSLTLILAAVACTKTEAPAGPLSVPLATAPSFANRAAAVNRTLLDGFNAHDAQKLASAYAADATATSYGASEYRGRAAIAEHIAAFFKAYPDAKASIARTWRGNDVDVLEWVVTGRSLGDVGPTKLGMTPVDFVGASVFIAPLNANKRPVGFVGASVLWLDSNGLIAQEHAYSDSNTPLLQLDRADGDARPIATLPASAEVHAARESADEAKNLELHKTMYTLAGDKKPEPFAFLADDLVLEDYGDPDARKPVSGLGAKRRWLPTPEGKRDVLSSTAVEDFTLVEETLHRSVANKLFTIHGLDVIEWKGGKAIKAWTYSNSKEFYDQLLPRMPTNAEKPAAGPTAPKPDKAAPAKN